jgi:hypothetical protein
MQPVRQGQVSEGCEGFAPEFVFPDEEPSQIGKTCPYTHRQGMQPVRQGQVPEGCEGFPPEFAIPGEGGSLIGKTCPYVQR